MESGLHYHIHKIPPQVPIPGQINPVYAPIPLLENSFQYYPSTKPRSSNLSCSLQFLHQTIYAPLLSPVPVICPANLILIDLITQITTGEECHHKAPNYAVFSSLLSLAPSQSQISSSAPYSHSGHVPPSV